MLFSRRFFPYLVTQALGALNDNIFKNTLVLLLTYQASTFSTSLGAGAVANLAAGLFILPFALFSGMGGHLADHNDKASLMRALKLTELIIMLVASVGLWFNQFELLMFTVFLMGTQSAFFGPVKYSILPASLPESEITAGNAWVEMSTFLMILLGTIFAGVLASYASTVVICIVIVSLSALGMLASQFIPASPPASKAPVYLSTLWTSNASAFSAARELRSVWLSVMGISWFWFLGATVLAQLPSLAKETLLLNEAGLTWLLALFSVGVGMGSLLCEKLSGHQVEIGLVPIGSLGLSVGLLGSFFTVSGADSSLLNETFADNAIAIEFGLWLALSGLFGGLYIVPLYALIQTRADKARVAGVIAANNVLNAAFMVASAMMGLAFALLGWQASGLLLFAALFNAVVAAYIYGLVPEFMWRFVIWMLVHTIYRFKAKGLENIPKEGPAVLVCNHVGFSDAVILGAAVRRPPRFIMYYKIFQNPLLGWFFRTAKAIPIASRNEDERIFNKAFDGISKALEDGELVIIFPEGKLTADGEIDVFKPGLLRVLERNPVPVIPMALGGLWGSLFTRRNKGFFGRVWRREQPIGRPIDLVIGKPMPAADVQMQELRAKVQALRTRP